MRAPPVHADCGLALEGVSLTTRERRAFILAHTRVHPVPHAPEIALHVADEATELWTKTEEELGAIGLPPPFWAFAWAGGQALARYLLDHRDVVAGRRALDFAAGSGLVAIAAARAGAATVEASEIDEFAIEAIGLNATLNQVAVAPRFGDLVGQDDAWDVVLAGDVAYQKDMADRVMDWLETLALRGADVLIGDPGRTYLARERLTAIVEYRVPVTRALEDAEIKKSAVYRFR
jgi:predicted nicotinamide N-methyase